jgi:hypothetical protein
MKKQRKNYMPHPLLVQLLEEEKQETIEFIAAPLRYSTAHMAEMTHAQVLSDVATICACFWCMLQETAHDNVSCQQPFLQYLYNRRQAHFDEGELHKIFAAYYKSLSDLVIERGTKRESQEALADLKRIFLHLDTLISNLTPFSYRE